VGFAVPLLLLVSGIVLPTGAAETRSTIRQVDFYNSAYPWVEENSVPGELQWLPPTERKRVRLVNGRLELEAGGYLKFEAIHYGDLTGDGREEAVVILRYGTGGTANWSYGYVYTLVSRKPRLLARFRTGSRATHGLYQLGIAQGILTIDLLDPAKAIADCCSNGFIRARYRWRNGAFKETGPREFGPVPASD